MNSIKSDRVYMRSLATRQSNLALSKHVADAISILKVSDYDLIILETSGIGQSDTEILDHSDVSLYVMTPEYGAATQLEKIDMLDFADFISINKFDKIQIIITRNSCSIIFFYQFNSFLSGNLFISNILTSVICCSSVSKF